MPKRIPSKLPPASGEGPVALGFKLSFDKINEIIDYLESLKPVVSLDSQLEHGINGVIRKPKGKAEEVITEGGDSRWA